MPELLPRTANGRATRRRILDSATELIAERGVAAVALDDVRERSRTSKSQLYLYFPGRRELLRAVARNTACLVLGAQDGHVEQGFGQVERFEAWCDDIVDAQAGPHGRRGCPLGGLVAQLSEHDDEARAVLAEAFDAWERPLADGFRAMADRGELRPG
ncbi:TetR/AcrR family transcriptional regulator, partial [Patulibacter minatonensis]|uniref:TetR/AcrR family transcriptional regulator n=1 Tax=Patulibacter minatonensis TaxID=298163 RepID=UPI0006840538